MDVAHLIIGGQVLTRYNTHCCLSHVNTIISCLIVDEFEIYDHYCYPVYFYTQLTKQGDSHWIKTYKILSKFLVQAPAC